MANSVDPDKTAPSGAVWSGSTLFVYVILSDALVFEFLGHLPYLMRCLKCARMANSVDSDQTAPLGAIWSGTTSFLLEPVVLNI